MLEAAQLLHDLTADIESSTKAHWSESGDAGFGGIVTRWDVFIQDFISGRIKAQVPGTCVLGEEKAGLLNDDRLDQALTVVIDPIDGTQWFVDGRYEYSILVTILEDGRPVWSAGVFPRTMEYLVGDTRSLTCYPRDLPRVFPSASSLPRVCAHYRLARTPHAEAAARLAAARYELAVNGSGFGTNLTGVREVVTGQSVGFISSKMSIIDGFATAHLIQSAGGVVRFYDVEASIDQWLQRDDWSHLDFGSDVGRRTRFIAARDSVVLNELEALLMSKA